MRASGYALERIILAAQAVSLCTAALGDATFVNMRWTSLLSSRARCGVTLAATLVSAPPAIGCHCGSAKGEPIPDEGALPPLRTGTLEPPLRDRVRGEVVGQWRDETPEGLGGSYLEIALDPVSSLHAGSVHVVIEGYPNALATASHDRGPLRILARFPDDAPRTTVQGVVYVRNEEWVRVPFEARRGDAVNPDEALILRWSEAYADHLGTVAREARGAHPWHVFAQRRLEALGRGHAEGWDARARHPMRRERIAELMATSTGMTSLQESLQHDRDLRLRDALGDLSVDVADVEPPPLRPHPYAEMLDNLPASETEPEPLAAATPADFWYFRFRSATTLGTTLEEAENWLIPARRLADRESHRHDIVARYQAQLGLQRSFAEVLGLSAASSGVALVGSDPYLREGSDVTMIWATSDARALLRVLEQMRSREGARKRSVEHRGYEIEICENPSGLRQHITHTDDRVVVSNSLAATKAVIDTLEGRRDRLGDEADFAYMRARDARTHDAFLFFSDRFIAAVVGPEQKILQSRRQRALSELVVPGYASLLYGWLKAESPANAAAVESSGLFTPDELVHFDGSPIAFSVHDGASSQWGRPDFLTPLIDLPAVHQVSDEEARAYESFAEGYQDNWSQAIDPIAAGFDFDERDGVLRIDMDARVIPVIEGTSYDDLRRVVADAHVSSPPGLPGVRLTWAIGEDSRTRRRLDRLGSTFDAGLDLGLGWLGRWVEVGVLDRHALPEVVAALDERIQLPSPEAHSDGFEGLAKLSELPIYVAAEVRNQAALAAMLTAGRTAANAAAPGMLEWGQHSRHRGNAIVEVRGPKAGSIVPTLYYAFTDDAIVLALRLDTLQLVLDRLEDGRGPEAARDSGQPQFVVDISAAEGRGLATAAGWLFHAEALEGHASALLDAEALLRGQPGAGDFADNARRMFGTVPVAADGTTDFTLTPAGAATPTLGSVIAPRYPGLPIEGSPAHSMVEHLQRFRAEVGFEREPGNADRESLRIRVTLESR